MSASATLWPCGTWSTSTRPDGSTVPAGRPPALATMATLSFACIAMSSGADAGAVIAAPAAVASDKSVLLAGGRASRMLQLDARDVLDDHQVGEHGDQRVEADEHECAVERAGRREDVADDDRRDDARGVAEHVEDAAREADHFLGRGVRHHGPAQRTDALAEEGERHEADDEPFAVDVVAGDHADGEQHPAD